MKKYVFGALLLNSISIGFSQIQPGLSPSPSSSSLGKYGSYPVNYNTELTNISVPLYEIKQNGVSVPIAISYHHSGIKVDDITNNAV